MLVEPYANDRVEDNLNPIGRIYYNASVLLCNLNSLAQEVGAPWALRPGEATLREVVAEAGFTRFRRAAETPFKSGLRGLGLRDRPSVANGALMHIVARRAWPPPPSLSQRQAVGNLIHADRDVVASDDWLRHRRS